MRHLFLIHSNPTLFSALGIIRHEQLDASDCSFVPVGNYRFPELPAGIRVVELRKRGRFILSSYKAILRSRSVVKLSDADVEKVCQGEPFHLYLPHSYHNADHLVLSHPLCSSYSYMEEGLTSYYVPGEINVSYPVKSTRKREKIAKFLLHNKRLPSRLEFYDDGYRNAYGFTDRSFPDWPRKVTIGLPDYLKPKAGVLPKSSPVLIFDAIVELGHVSIASMVGAVDELLAWLTSPAVKSPTLRFKFHRGQLTSVSKGKIRELFEKYAATIDLQELPPEASLEDIATSEDCEFYVFNSAAGLYASLAGREVTTLNPIVIEKDADYAKTVAALPAVYSEFVKPINLSRLRKVG